MKKKIISLLLVLVMLCSLGLWACGEADDSDNGGNSNSGGTSTDGGSGGSDKDEGNGEDQVKYNSYAVDLKGFTLKSEGGASISVEDAKLTFERLADGTLIGEGEGNVIDGEGEAATEKPCRIAVVDGKAYFLVESDGEGDSDILTVFSLDAFLSAVSLASGVDIASMLESASSSDALSNWFADDLLPALGTLNSSVLIGKIDEYKAAAWSALITEGEGGRYAVRMSDISELNKVLSEMNGKAAYEHYFGEDSFIDLKAAIAGSLAISVNDLLAKIEKQGADREKLLLALDKLAAIFAKDDSATVESLLGLDKDIGQMLEDPAVAEYSFSDLLKEITGISSDSDLSNMLAEFYSQLAKETLYSYVGELFGNSAIEEKIPALIGGFSDGASIEFTLDGEGRVNGIFVICDFSGEGNALSAIAREISITYSEGSAEIAVKFNYPQPIDAGCTFTLSASEESLSGGKIFREISDRLSDLPDEDELRSNAKKLILGSSEYTVNFIYDDKGNEKYAIVYSEEKIGEVDFGENEPVDGYGIGVCKFTRRETLIDLSGFTSLSYSFEGMESVVIVGDAVIADAIRTYDMKVEVIPGGYKYNSDSLEAENCLSQIEPESPRSGFVFFYNKEKGTLSSVIY